MILYEGCYIMQPDCIRTKQKDDYEDIMKENKKIEECVITVKKMSEDEKMQRLAF